VGSRGIPGGTSGEGQQAGAEEPAYCPPDTGQYPGGVVGYLEGHLKRDTRTGLRSLRTARQIQVSTLGGIPELEGHPEWDIWKMMLHI
jgi:hypothetical protein